MSEHYEDAAAPLQGQDVAPPTPEQAPAQTATAEPASESVPAEAQTATAAFEPAPATPEASAPQPLPEGDGAAPADAAPADAAPADAAAAQAQRGQRNGQRNEQRNDQRGNRGQGRGQNRGRQGGQAAAQGGAQPNAQSGGNRGQGNRGERQKHSDQIAYKPEQILQRMQNRPGVYRAYLHEAEALLYQIRLVGLGPALAVLLSQTEHKSKRRIYWDISKWVFKEQRIKGKNVRSLMESIVYGDPRFLLKATHSVVNFLEDLVRLSQQPAYQPHANPKPGASSHD